MITAKRTFICPGCMANVHVGDSILPFDRDNEKAEWLHAECARARCGPEGLVCRHWRRKGHCAFGDRCMYTHPESLRGGTDNSDEIPARARAWGGRRNRVHNAHRAAFFRRFLVSEFGLEMLCQGSGVLDVAGGKGELAFQLTHLNAVPCTVVDPRELRLHQYRKKLQFGFYDRNAVFSTFNTRNHARAPLRHLRILFEMAPTIARTWPKALAEQVLAEIYPAPEEKLIALSSPTRFADSLLQAASTVWTAAGLEDTETLEEDEAMSYAVSEDACENEVEEITEYSDAVKIVENCSVVVGMHPDQAAEHIVDFCVAHRRPFAIVPCCLYTKEFPRRLLQNGEPIRSYDDFVEYLCAKDPLRIRSTVLDFEGRNRVVFCPLTAD
eukprot:TRINITY_DN5415_c0_g1_i1.p1 TRINITY_DN5415_c0_g1~~TRINITY_DN5415_c0_g1_i1.p1  ORF type:complete len:383 (-),score=35.16 TRINITY_DN5415_c0_g1_i1:5-1153(-)